MQAIDKHHTFPTRLINALDHNWSKNTPCFTHMRSLLSRFGVSIAPWAAFTRAHSMSCHCPMQNLGDLDVLTHLIKITPSQSPVISAFASLPGLRMHVRPQCDTPDATHKCVNASAYTTRPQHDTLTHTHIVQSHTMLAFTYTPPFRR